MTESEKVVADLAAVTEEKPSNIPITAPYIPIGTAVLCAAEPAHVYDAVGSSACPRCGSMDRLMLEQLLSPEVLGPRLMKAIRKAGRSA